jgi:hypothetical protein
MDRDHSLVSAKILPVGPVGLQRRGRCRRFR